MTVVWNFPTRILFGEGSALTVGSEVKHLHGKRALLVTDDGVNGARLTEPITEALSRSGIETAVFHGVSANPL
jgi:alcohol dehydrogenase